MSAFGGKADVAFLGPKVRHPKATLPSPALSRLDCIPLTFKLMYEERDVFYRVVIGFTEHVPQWFGAESPAVTR